MPHEVVVDLQCLADSTGNRGHNKALTAKKNNCFGQPDRHCSTGGTSEVRFSKHHTGGYSISVFFHPERKKMVKESLSIRLSPTLEQH